MDKECLARECDWIKKTRETMTSGQVRRLVILHGAEKSLGQLERNTATPKPTTILTILRCCNDLEKPSRTATSNKMGGHRQVPK